MRSLRMATPRRPSSSGLGALHVCHQGDVAGWRLLLENVHQLPSVLAERVQDVARVVGKKRGHEVLPLLHANLLAIGTVPVESWRRDALPANGQPDRAVG